MDMGDVTADMWQLCDSLALLISKPPSKDVAKQREYYSIIGPQLANLVSKSSQSKVTELLEQSIALKKILFLNNRHYQKDRSRGSLPVAIER